MLPPVQNQDLVQRSDTTSAMRSQEQGKVFGDIAKSAAEMQRLDEQKNNTVQQDDGSEALNPDGGGSEQEQRRRRKKQEEEEMQPETNTPAGHPLKLEGGDIIDFMA